ncbi:Transcriptional regulator ATRX [Operophtera brumata]|uniref:Transcriptional regulator ATRX n=1 Tax=Operophtera brumata TaxID=104452 RepID=A0A0L7L1M0_OPEBR|nr:Transcriptional regulator ATRX [Operophtera brumata]
MSEIATIERASAEPERKPVVTNDDVKFPPFPDPTDDDFDEDVTEEEKTHYKNKFLDLNKIVTVRLHCTACDRHLGCSADNDSLMRLHPMLRTLICNNCHSFYNSGEFDKGEDGSELYCRWCGQGGQVYCCSDCVHVFCAKCIKRNLGLPKIREIENTDDWKCFKCNPKCLWDLRAVCWALLRYCDLRNRLVSETEDRDLKQQYAKAIAIDLTECCKNKARRGLKGDSAKKREKEVENIAKKIISKMPPTIQDDSSNVIIEVDMKTSLGGKPMPKKRGRPIKKRRGRPKKSNLSGTEVQVNEISKESHILKDNSSNLFIDLSMNNSLANAPTPLPPLKEMGSAIKNKGGMLVNSNLSGTGQQNREILKDGRILQDYPSNIIIDVIMNNSLAAAPPHQPPPKKRGRPKKSNLSGAEVQVNEILKEGRILKPLKDISPNLFIDLSMNNSLANAPAPLTSLKEMGSANKNKGGMLVNSNLSDTEQLISEILKEGRILKDISPNLFIDLSMNNSLANAPAPLTSLKEMGSANKNKGGMLVNSNLSDIEQLISEILKEGRILKDISPNLLIDLSMNNSLANAPAPLTPLKEMGSAIKNKGGVLVNSNVSGTEQQISEILKEGHILKVNSSNIIIDVNMNNSLLAAPPLQPTPLKKGMLIKNKGRRPKQSNLSAKEIRPIQIKTVKPKLSDASRKEQRRAITARYRARKKAMAQIAMMTSPSLYSPMRYPAEKKVLNLTRIQRPRILGNNFNGYNSPGAFNPMNMNNMNNMNLNNMNNMNLNNMNNMNLVNDNINLSLDSLTQVTEDNDDDVECITPAPVAAPKVSNPPPLAPVRATPLTGMPKGNVIQMTDSDVTVNALTGGLKFRVDPQTLSSNKMYRLPDGRIFAINANPNMPGGYSATIVSQNPDGSPKVTPRSETFAAKLSAVSHASSPKAKRGGRNAGPQRRKTTLKNKPAKPKEPKAPKDASRETDLKVPVEWYRYNMIDAVDALEYSLSRLHKLKKEATSTHLRTRTIDEMKYLHRTLEQLLTTSSKRFIEIRDTLNKEMKMYLTSKESGENSSEEDDDDVEILPNTELDDPIFIDENSVDSVNGTESQEVDLTGVGSSEHNDSAENRNDADPLNVVEQEHENINNLYDDSTSSANVLIDFGTLGAETSKDNSNGDAEKAKEQLLVNHDETDKMDTDEPAETSNNSNEESSDPKAIELNGDDDKTDNEETTKPSDKQDEDITDDKRNYEDEIVEKENNESDDKTDEKQNNEDEIEKENSESDDKTDEKQNNEDEIEKENSESDDKTDEKQNNEDEIVENEGDYKQNTEEDDEVNSSEKELSDKKADQEIDKEQDGEMSEEMIETLLKDDNLDENASMEISDLQEAEQILS